MASSVIVFIISPPVKAVLGSKMDGQYFLEADLGDLSIRYYGIKYHRIVMQLKYLSEMLNYSKMAQF